MSLRYLGPFPYKDLYIKALRVAWRKALSMLWRVHPMTHYDIRATMSEMLPLEIQFNYCFAKFYIKCKSHESQLVQTIIMVASSNPMFPVGTNIKNAHTGDLLYNEWFLTNVGKNRKNSIKLPHDKSFKDYLKNRNNLNFTFQNIDEENVNELINKLSPKTSFGFDGVSSNVCEE